MCKAMRTLLLLFLLAEMSLICPLGSLVLAEVGLRQALDFRDLIEFGEDILKIGKCG